MKSPFSFFTSFKRLSRAFSLVLFAFCALAGGLLNIRPDDRLPIAPFFCVQSAFPLSGRQAEMKHRASGNTVAGCLMPRRAPNPGWVHIPKNKTHEKGTEKNVCEGRYTRISLHARLAGHFARIAWRPDQAESGIWTERLGGHSELHITLGSDSKHDSARWTTRLAPATGWQIVEKRRLTLFRILAVHFRAAFSLFKHFPFQSPQNAAQRHLRAFYVQF